jgi:hypothetical protein
MTLRGSQALVAAETYFDVVLSSDGREVTPEGVRAFMKTESLSAADLDLSARVFAEIYHLVCKTPTHVHHGPPARRRP